MKNPTAAKRRILLADDSVTIQKVVNLTFADEGIEVVAVGDGDAAMRKLFEVVPDLVMLDVNMPGTSGYVICEMIKQDAETRHIPVILLVGSFEPFDEAEARRVGADDFLTKPFQSIRQLVGKVSVLLNGGENVADNEETIDFEVAEDFRAPIESIKIFDDAAAENADSPINQIGSLPVSDALKYDSATLYQSPSNEIGEADETAPRHENIYDFAERHESEESNAAAETDDSPPETTSKSENFAPEIVESKVSAKNETPATFTPMSDAEINDFDLLELSSAGKTDGERTAVAAKKNAVSEHFAPVNLSPEAVEAVADRVIEKLSDRVIERIVGEVIAQINREK